MPKKISNSFECSTNATQSSQQVGFCFVKCTGVKIKQASRVNISASQKQQVQFDFLNHSLNFQETHIPE